ncbi:MAG: nicotinate-nucleotide adenylyltransferase [Chloroflexi bacterium]|nr:nicotinate-nucleotide adenylyltransferase [Chloroflexota bacterium]
MAKRGVFGGSFNPVHVGHLLVAESVREAAGLDEVVFVPASRPWMKPAPALAPASDRWAMIQLAIGQNERFSASRVDLDRDGPSYAVDTIRDLVRESGDEYFFIMGADALTALPEWHEADELLRLCRVVAVERPGWDGAAALAGVERALPGATNRICAVSSVLIDVSSSDLRRRIKDGRSIKYRVPPAVEEYIAERGLYR